MVGGGKLIAARLVRWGQALLQRVGRLIGGAVAGRGAA
jgi:hypothetical protein